MPGQLGFDYDWKPQSDGSYSPEQMHRLLYDLNDEPNWRPNASLEMQFYDGNQLDQPTLALMQERGVAPQIINMREGRALRALELYAMSLPKPPSRPVRRPPNWRAA